MRNRSNDGFILTDYYQEPAKCEEFLPPLPPLPPLPLPPTHQSAGSRIMHQARDQRLPSHGSNFSNQQITHRFHSANTVNSLCTTSPTSSTFKKVPETMNCSSPGRPKSDMSLADSFCSLGLGGPSIAIPPDQRSRALWFLETLGSAALQITGVQISPNVFLPRKFWKMAIVSPEHIQIIEHRIKAIKRVLKYQSSFEKSFKFHLKGGSLFEHFSSRLILAKPEAMLSPHDPTHVNSGTGASTVFRRLPSELIKGNLTVRYATMATQLLEAVKREYSFGLETPFVDFVLETITPCFVDDVFDLHALYMDHLLKKIVPDIGNLT